MSLLGCRPSTGMATPPADLRAGWRDAIRRAGLRVTPQREAVLAAVWRQRHATADSLVAELAAADSAVNLSTVYRSLEALEQIGLVRHAHLGAGSPTYHIAVEHPHLHLQCRSCGRLQSLPVEAAASFAGEIERETGFLADFTHAAIHGTCAECVVAGDGPGGDDEA